MKTIKIIDMLVNMANGKKVPKKIKYQNCIYIYDEYDEYYYIDGNPDNYSLFSEFSYSSLTSLMNFLNEEVEIIEDKPKEDKKLEKLRAYEEPFLKNGKVDTRFLLIIDQLDEIIDKINGGEK